MTGCQMTKFVGGPFNTCPLIWPNPSRKGWRMVGKRMWSESGVHVATNAFFLIALGEEVPLGHHCIKATDANVLTQTDFHTEKQLAKGYVLLVQGYLTKQIYEARFCYVYF